MVRWSFGYIMKMDCIVVMGKRPSPGSQPLELMARAAFAAIYWHLKAKGTIIFCVEGFDIAGIFHSGSEIVKNVVVDIGGVPLENTIVRSLSNCTSREVIVIKQVMEDHFLRSPLVITHPYHRARTYKYFSDIGIDVNVVGCSIHEVMNLNIEKINPALIDLIFQAEPEKPQLIREFIVESGLSTLHLLDKRGVIERYLSDRIRGSGCIDTSNIV